MKAFSSFLDLIQDSTGLSYGCVSPSFHLFHQSFNVSTNSRNIKNNGEKKTSLIFKT